MTTPNNLKKLNEIENELKKISPIFTSETLDLLKRYFDTKTTINLCNLLSNKELTKEIQQSISQSITH